MTTAGWLEARVVHWRKWEPGLATLHLDACVEDFEPGQFFQLALDIKGERVRRSYSVASAPGQPLEFYLKNVSGGALTPHLFQLKVGDRVWLESTPRGFFTLSYVPQCSYLWLVATGTGLGPFISMLRTPSTWQHAGSFIVVHGVRTPSQLAYREELERLAQERPLRYVPVVSRPSAPLAGSELSGRITAAFENGSLERAAGVPIVPDGHHVLLCGNPEMIQDMMPRLEARGLRRHRVRRPGHVTTEKYW